MDAPAARIQALSATINESLSAGIDLPGDVLAFVEGMAGEISAQALRELLDSGDATGESVLDLVFFPERPLRNRLEPLLGAGLSALENEALLALLDADQQAVPLRFPDGGVLELIPPTWVLERLLSRLRLTRQVPEVILEQLNDALGEQRALPYRTLLRNSRCAWSEENILFFQTFLRRASLAPGQEARYTELFQAALAFMDEAPMGCASYTALMDRKRFYHAALEKARQFKETARGLPMEALLSRGVTPPVMTEQDAMTRIRLLDALSLTVYGHTDPLESPTHEHVPVDPDMLPEDF
ncbi:hypothetical protein [Megalodesulfovibrio paquesii]